jgi:hypothetical protein
VGPRRRTVSIKLPARPKSGVLRIPLTITAGGVNQPPLREEIVMLRL